MVGGVFEGSNSRDFSVKDTLFVIKQNPLRLHNVVVLRGMKPYRYVRYYGPENSYCDVSEVAFYEMLKDTCALQGTPMGTSNAPDGDLTHDYTNVFDGDHCTSFRYRLPSGGWAGLDLGRPYRIGKIVFTPRNRDNYIYKGETYELFYSSQGEWNSAGTRIAVSDSLLYTVPKGALFYLKNYTRGKDERILNIMKGYSDIGNTADVLKKNKYENERTTTNSSLGKQIDKFIFYLCLLATIYIAMQVFVVTSFSIPSESMSPSMLAGDCVLVDKCSGGARIFNVLKALDSKDVNIYRMPGWRNFKRNDVLVFNFPYKAERWDSIAFDVMKYYVKRCVALPGDTLEIRNGYYKLRGVSGEIGSLIAQQQIAALPDSGTNVVIPCFPWNDKLKWTIKEFGPLPVPAKGQVVKMNSLSYTLYRQLINWEQNNCHE